ncbi:hypothetical protein pEaSNUABM28_00046 [Erwinia phage pEa_SNUABM_28]|uniref:Uncharacterized protein n=2 Tax=Alexandravirus TaxID=2733088 RepID=A0AAE9BUB2_9CAUD|nr:hypothetical protein MPK63_gp045 [Erwinia phage pEa_SNUABM_22]YP_010299806.1 hypothetical protein MPK64_gp045 [Erwinia phage pEa_SNUABM_16]QZE58603.1 hypothetical protein pEaSNUABM28_00046 [Erwinia phage pEa_SNUABM_28]QZE58948.1 hypothetical protein pEaSNUABM18_00045 [Erwinia phage pEa_SNUABM_18]UAW96189.1 hypothetical protein pEaSNUABM16_00045 [Erwinia phage pEa_SNUABM_16]UAW96533.1 hypothetical protein pEaSNUABM22_00045 [Erwinia phage pEa_SNUABM_22]
MQYDKTKDYQPFKYLGAPKLPNVGFIASTVTLVENDVNIGEDECEFVFTVEQMNSLDRGTMTFRAKDAGGGISIKKCSVSGLKMVIKLERRVVQFGKVQVEWATTSRKYLY